MSLRSSLHLRLPRTLTSRLVVTAVALVALVGILVAVSATVAMRGYLTDRLDNQVRDALQRAPRAHDERPATPDRPDGPDNSFGHPFGQGPGTLVALVPGSAGTAAGLTTAGVIVTNNALVQTAPVPIATVQRLSRIAADDRGHSVTVSGVGYRVMVQKDTVGDVLIVGLPTTEIDSTISTMVTRFALLTLIGVALAGLVGTLLVRRQLRPLYAVADTAHEVASQDLSTGETTISTRVSPELTDPQTEVGQVGSALNTLLDHVEIALAARHRSEEQVRQFVADASHELRTPLSTIHGYAELSRRTPDDAGALSAALSKVETEAGRMSALVEDLLLLARLDSGRPLAQEEVDLTRLLLEAVTDAQVLAPDHHWRLDLPEEPVTVRGDEARLHQVVTNLLNNARSHTPPGTTVTVAAESTGDRVRVRVHDDGPGLPEELVAEAFDRFSRGDSSRTRASGGAGLGLSLVSAISLAHGGQATVVSAPGETTFTVDLPRVGND